MNGNHARVIQIKDYIPEAVKIVIEWIKGCIVLLYECKNIKILADTILFADYYDFQRHALLDLNSFSFLYFTYPADLAQK